MAKVHLEMIFMAFLLATFTLGCGPMKLVNGQTQKTWCVAKPSTDDNALKNNIKYACDRVDCSAIDVNGKCHNPDILISQASVVMNKYYRQTGKDYLNCDFTGSGLIVVTDPSYGECNYA